MGQANSRSRSNDRATSNKITIQNMADSMSESAQSRGAVQDISNSKYQKRVDRILQRLSDMQIQIEHDKRAKLRNLDGQLGQTRSTLNHWQDANLKKFGVLKEAVMECMEYIEEGQGVKDN
jgi:gas vesicle protein